MSRRVVERYTCATRRSANALLGVLLISLAVDTNGIEGMALEVERLVGSGWHADALSVQIAMDQKSAARPRMSVGLGALNLLGVELRDLHLVCPRGVLSDTGLECPRGRLSFAAKSNTDLVVPVDLLLAPDRFHLHLHSSDGRGAAFDAKAQGHGGVWRASSIYRLHDPGAIAALLRALFDNRAPAVEEGQAELELDVSGSDAVTQGKLSLRLLELSLSDSSGLNAGERVSLALNIEFRGDESSIWEFEASLSLQGGGVFVAPWFIAADPQPVSADFRGRFDTAAMSLALDTVSVRHPGVLEASGGVTLSFTQSGVQIDALKVDMPRHRVRPIHHSYLAPWFLAKALGDFEADGSISLALDWRRDGSSRMALDLDGLYVLDAESRFALNALSGVLRWGRGRPVEPTRLQWDALELYAFELGATALEGELHDTRFTLSEPFTLPMLDGVIEVVDLDVEQVFSSQASWRFAGSLGPVSMPGVSRTLGWPEFSGTVSATIPDAQYSNGRLSLGGDVEIEAFDGRIVVSGLQLEDPFGLVPRLRADVSLSEVSLGLLTDTFSFGTIEGRLEGRVDDLVLEDWQPRSFDARFGTPEDDPSKHRISQRAVKSLAEIGGAGKVLSSTLLRLFNEFSYARLGLSCRLERGVCHMGGVEPAPNGYYIVKGGGFIPRIDIIGFNERVDWNTLVDRLEGATSLPGPIVK